MNSEVCTASNLITANSIKFSIVTYAQESASLTIYHTHSKYIYIFFLKGSTHFQYYFILLKTYAAYFG